MGGLALKHFDVVRLERENFDKLVIELTGKLHSFFGNEVKFDPIPFYHNKKDFGDLDILYSSNQNITEKIIGLINPNQFVNNSPVLSIVYVFEGQNFQIDFIRVIPEEHEFALSYFSYNDFSNLIGRIFHSLGLKLGHDGLFYVFRNEENPNQIIGEILITRDYLKALEIGDYYNFENQEFNELEDIFHYVTISKYFNNDIFLLKNRNHISRTRDRKRPTYMKFLKWVKDFKGPQFDWSSKTEIRKEILEKLFIIFPDFKNRLNEILEKQKEKKVISLKFNGHLVKEWTGLEGKELGKFLKISRGWFDNNKGINHYSSKEIKLITIFHFRIFKLDW